MRSDPVADGHAGIRVTAVRDQSRASATRAGFTCSTHINLSGVSYGETPGSACYDTRYVEELDSHKIEKFDEHLVDAGYLGVSVAAPSSWGTMVEQFATSQNTTKFLVRRFGLIGAVSRPAGIIWKYV